MTVSGWREPESQLVVAALSRIGDAQHRRVFFERLENPLWVVALTEHGVYDVAPETRVDSQGREFWQPWPAGEYLVRMAPLVPEEVVTALLRPAESSSPIVHDVFLRASLSVPGHQAIRLLPAISSYAAEGSLRNTPELVDLMEHLARSGKGKQAVRLAQAAFRPRPLGEEHAGGRPRRRDVTAGMESYWFGELLPRVIAVLGSVQGEKALTTLTAWLEEFQLASGHFDAGREYDLSYIWRPSIAPHSQNGVTEDYGDDLVDAVRDLASAQLQAGRPVTAVLETLERSGQPLLRRIALHVLSGRVADDPASVQEAASRLLDVDLVESDYRHEYTELARQALPLLDKSAAQAWERMILEGPPFPEDTLQAAAERGRQEGEDLEVALERFREYWQLRILSAVGRASLSQPCVERLAALEDNHGRLEHSDFPAYSTSWVGPSSPHTAEELTALEPGELLALLRTWRPETDTPRDQSKEGLGRAFQAAVRDRPEAITRDPSQLVDLDPTYLRALFGGLREALEDETAFDWAPVFTVALAVATRPDDGTEVEGGMDEDVVWRFAQRALASLIEMGVSVDGAHAIRPEQLDAAVDVLEPLIAHPDPTREHEQRYGGSNMDPLTLSLNTTRPAVLRALVRVGSKAKDRLEAGAPGAKTSTITRVLGLVEQRLSGTRDNSLAVAAAFGEGIGRLIWMDRAWADAHGHELMTPDAFGDVVLTAALATYRPSKVLLEVLSPYAGALIERTAAGETITQGWRADRTPEELVGDHLVLMLVWGAVEPDDDLASAFFQDASKPAIARVLGHLGWLFSRSDEPLPAEMIERAMALWDRRAEAVRAGATSPEELAEFYWWVRSGQFPREWWLARLEQAVGAAATFDARGMIGEDLEQAAPEAPLATIRILERLLAGREEAFSRYDLVEHATGIIAAALDSGDAEAVTTANRVMDTLGRSGHLRIAELVEQRRDRRS